MDSQPPYKLVAGDNILLYSSSRVVAVGSVHSVISSDLCNGVQIGEGRISAQILTAIDASQILPYPNVGASIMSEAVNSFVLWDMNHCHVIGQAPLTPSEQNDRAGPSVSNQALLIEASPPNTRAGEERSGRKAGLVSKEEEIYFKFRKNWSNKSVTLLSKIEGEPLAEGIIFLPFVNSCIDGVEVGEEYAGLYKAFVDSESSGRGSEPQEEGEKRKRPYSSVKRQKPDPTTQFKKKLSQKRSSRCTTDDVNKALEFSCTCTNTCMSKVLKKDVHEERSFFYNEPFARHAAYILTKFDQPGFKDGKMLFVDGLLVCKPAFWTIYGFVRQTFYNYEKAFMVRGSSLSEVAEKLGHMSVHFRVLLFLRYFSGSLKPKDTTLFTKACMKMFFQQTAEPLPHKESKNDNTDGIMYRLPKAYSREDVYKEICQKMIAVGLAPISGVAFENIWKKDFPNYGIHNSSAFAKCETCIHCMNMLHRERRSAERSKWEHLREMHLKHQMSGRNVYYSHRQLSTAEPTVYLSFIHDAMDLTKTIIPRLSEKHKSLMGQVQPLPLKVIGILNHGHEPSVVAHVSVGALWPSDPNLTITSITKQLRDYETYYAGDMSGDLAFATEALHPLFATLLHEEVFNKTVLGKRSQTRDDYFRITKEERSRFMQGSSSTRKLPPHLYIQLDNSAKDNKNWAMMAFCSELIARGCCKTITMSFLLVGHTHEDVDAFFSKVNAAQGGKNIESLPHFLAEVYHAQSSKAYPRLIQEMADYKHHAIDYVDKISSQSAPVAFRFYMRDNLPVYQVQENYGDRWVPPHGRSMWKRSNPDSDTNFEVVLPPRQNPPAVPIQRLHSKQGEVLGFIKNYIKYKEEMLKTTDPSSSHHMDDTCLVDYWKKVSEILGKDLTVGGGNTLVEGFWPITDYGSGHRTTTGSTPSNDALALVIHAEMVAEIEEREEIFVGQAAARKLANFVPLIDVAAGLMLILRPSDDFVCQDCLWVVKALGPVCTDAGDRNINKIPIQWWRPKHASSKASDEDRYAQCIQRDVVWEIDPGYTGRHWIDADSCVYAWKSRAKKDKVHLP
ncbi:hypothetical protein R1sor_021671 [Riccia sorocarpa]|uniref:DUF7869 domain-containing protein n=1 Tax=Riccia sorocarpa TaxID=122646 RepID=A0ABD3GL09_9MARC